MKPLKMDELDGFEPATSCRRANTTCATPRQLPWKISRHCQLDHNQFTNFQDRAVTDRYMGFFISDLVTIH